MFNADFINAKQIHDQNLREAEQRQATYRLSRELRAEALSRAAAEKQPLLTRITERLHLKRAA
jgi:hypothetical protein